MKSLREIILKYGTCFLVFVLPLVVFPNFFFYYISSKTFLMYGIISILFPLWLYSVYIDKSYRLSRTQLLFFIPPILYILWMTIAGFAAVNPHLSFWSTFERGTGLITLYFVLMFSFIVSSIIKKEGTPYIVLLLKSILLGSFILALTVWASDRGLNLHYLIFEFSRGGGLTGNPTVSSAYFIFSIFSGLYLLFSNLINKTWKIIISIILAVIILSPSFINIYSILISRDIIEISRAALLGIFVGLGASLLGYLSLSKKKTFKIIGIAGIFISLIIFSIGWASLNNTGSYLNKKFFENASGTRFIFWDIAQKTMDENPYLGYGPENYSIAFSNKFNPRLFLTENYTETISDKAHNVYFDNGVSGGYPAIIFYAFLIAGIFYAIYVSFRDNKITRIQAGFLWGLLVAYIFQNLFSFDSNISIFYFFAFMGIIYGFLGDSSDEQKDINFGKINKKVLDITIGGVFTTLAVFSVIYFAVIPSRKAILMQKVISVSPFLDKSSIYKDLLSSTSVGDDKDVSTLADVIFRIYTIDLANLELGESERLLLERDSKLFFDYLYFISKSNKTDFRLNIGLLRFNSIHHAITGKEASDDTFLILKNAMDQSPTNPEPYWWMAQVYYWLGNNEEAINSYKKAISLNIQIDLSHSMLIKYAIDTNNKELYAEAAAQARKDVPWLKF